MSSPEREKSPEPETAVEKQPKDDIDPVMQQYMAMVQQQKNKPQEKEVINMKDILISGQYQVYKHYWNYQLL